MPSIQVKGQSYCPDTQTHWTNCITRTIKWSVMKHDRVLLIYLVVNTSTLLSTGYVELSNVSCQASTFARFTIWNNLTGNVTSAPSLLRSFYQRLKTYLFLIYFHARHYTALVYFSLSVDLGVINITYTI